MEDYHYEYTTPTRRDLKKTTKMIAEKMMEIEEAEESAREEAELAKYAAAQVGQNSWWIPNN